MLNNSGLEYYNKGKYELALVQFKKAANTISISRVSKSTYLRNAALSYMELGNTDSSRHYFLRAANLHYEKSDVYLINMADVDLLDGNIDGAIQKTISPECLTTAIILA